MFRENPFSGTGFRGFQIFISLRYHCEILAKLRPRTFLTFCNSLGFTLSLCAPFITQKSIAWQHHCRYCSHVEAVVFNILNHFHITLVVVAFYSLNLFPVDTNVMNQSLVYCFRKTHGHKMHVALYCPFYFLFESSSRVLVS